MAANFGQREDLYSVQVVLVGTDGQKVSFTFDKFDGGAVKSKSLKYRPANGTQDQQSLGGPSEVEDVTVTALESWAVYQWLPWIIGQVGRATMYVNKQPLDENGSPFGKVLAYSGRLDGCTPSKTDSESDAPSLIILAQSSVTVASG
jgi:hypothetical protein